MYTNVLGYATVYPHEHGHQPTAPLQEKPYVESVESGDREDRVVAEEAWENHLKRNQSKVHTQPARVIGIVVRERAMGVVSVKRVCMGFRLDSIAMSDTAKRVSHNNAV